MWCVAPEWPEHARHLAVEFVHPVIIGKRALPALSVCEPELVGALGPSVATGDVLVAVGTRADRSINDVMLRAKGWGLHTFWFGCGEPPSPASADHVLWVDEDGLTAARDGALVLRYHLLWELTHVCFEHPGLLRPDAVERSSV